MSEQVKQMTLNGHDAHSGAADQLPPANCTEKVNVAVFTHEDGNKFIVPGLWAKQEKPGEVAAGEVMIDAKMFGFLVNSPEPQWREFPYDPVAGTVSTAGIVGTLKGPIVGRVDVIVIEGPAVERAKKLAQEGSSGQG